MARKWEITESKYAWNFEECEELLLIAAYEEIKPFVPLSSQWMAEFENHYYQHGNGVAFTYIDHINAARRRRNLETLDVIETDVLEYGRSTDKLAKSEFRRRARAEYTGASANVKQKLVDGALAKKATLLPPHQTFDEYKARSKRHTFEGDLSRREVARRVAAVTPPPTPPEPAKSPSLELSKALTMLTHGSEEIARRVVAKLTPDTALEALEHVQDQTVKDMLILHSLGETV
jgi:hypothetical protein